MRSGVACGLLLGVLSAAAHGQVAGLLKFPDSTVLPGVLLESTSEGGHFRSNRFGDITFRTGEATFEPARGTPTAPTPSVDPVDVAAPPASAWKPASWSVGLSGYAQSSNGNQERDADVDLEATWRTRRDEVNLKLSADYRVVGDAVDNNEQSGRLRWLRALSTTWVGVGGVRSERHTFTVDPLPTLDYLLIQGTLGLGLRKRWSDDTYSLVALGHDWIALDLLKYRYTLHTAANSLLVENKLQLLPKVSLAQTLYVYLWRDGDTGIDSQADLDYAVTDALSVGLRQEYRRNAVNLDIGTFSRLSLTTRLEF